VICLGLGHSPSIGTNLWMAPDGTIVASRGAQPVRKVKREEMLPLREQIQKLLNEIDECIPEEGKSYSYEAELFIDQANSLLEDMKNSKKETKAIEKVIKALIEEKASTKSKSIPSVKKRRMGMNTFATAINETMRATGVSREPDNI